MNKAAGIAVALVARAAMLAAAPAAAAACPPPPAVVTDITAERFYTDAAGSIPDPAAIARKKAVLRPLDDFVSAVVVLSDKAMEGDAAAGGCAAAWLAVWADGGAMLGRMSSTQAEYERKWRTAAFGFTALKLATRLSVDQRARIGRWLDSLADRAIALYDGTRHARNNHLYWAGLAAGVTAAVTGHSAHWRFALQTYDEAMAAIGPDGVLPLEMARRKKALHYHNFALAPLVMLAEVAARQGDDLYGRDPAIHRLVDRVLAGIADPEGFASLAGTAVEVPKGAMLGWLAFYGRRFPDRVAGRMPPDVTYWNAWLGGDMRRLAEDWGPAPVR